MQAMLRKRVMAGYGLFLFVLLVLTDCGGGEKPGAPQTGFSPGPGLGDSTGTPTGQPFQLPDGLTAGAIVGALHPLDGANQKILTQPQCGSYTPQPVETVNTVFGYVDLCMELVNGAGMAIPVTLPGGLIFPSLDDRIQSGFLAQSVAITVPAGGEWVLLRFYCLNARFPGADGAHYQIGPVTDYAPLKEVVSILQDKQIDQQETFRPH